MSAKKLGQYFTTSEDLQNTIISFIKNKPHTILEPSFGKGNLVPKLLEKFPNVQIQAYEIDKSLKPIENAKSDRINIIYKDFLIQEINRKFFTIIGNPPYVKTSTGNLYIKFIEKCINILKDNGELIFIVPSDFLKITSAQKIIKNMVEQGSFTDIYFPHKEKLFEGASIDVMIFRYKKTYKTNRIKINNKNMYSHFSNGILTFHETPNLNVNLLKDFFNIYVGMVSGKESVFKNDLGNILILNEKNITNKYILITEFPCDDDNINNYLLKHKNTLMERKIKKMTEKNWFQWGALRNIKSIKDNLGKPCIYITTLTRKKEIAFKGTVQFFGAKLICLVPKTKINLDNIVDFLNTDMFKENYIYSGRFKIGHKQISNATISTRHIQEIL